MINERKNFPRGHRRSIIAGFTDAPVDGSALDPDTRIEGGKLVEQCAHSPIRACVIDDAQLPILVDLADYRTHHLFQMRRRRIVNGRED